MNLFFVVFLLFVGGAFVLWMNNRRSNLDVIKGLYASGEAPVVRKKAQGTAASTKKVSSSHLIEVLVFIIVFSLKVKNGVVPALMFSGAVVIFVEGFFRSKKAKQLLLENKKIDFYLPLVMERLVMAVEAGLDIIPAVKSIVEIETATHQGNKPDSDTPDDALAKVDPVTRLLARVVSYTDSGVSFKKALEEVVKDFENPALRHAFIHLGIAYSDGGEIIGPLRELSDSTQLHYQESVEEEINKMPAKATAPLVFVFLGLVIFFLATPLIKIISYSKNNLMFSNSEIPQGGEAR